MNPSTSAYDPTAVLELFGAAADAVADVLAVTTDWGPSGLRDGQYSADLAADRACLDVLQRSGFRILSEESGFTGGSTGQAVPVIVVDPLDGSTNASRGIPWYATAVCLVADAVPVVAMVANHATGDRFTAFRGGGALRNGVACRPTSTVGLEHAIVGVSGLPHRHYGWDQYRALGASAPDICNVAWGAIDAWCDIHDHHGVWDYLASILIAEEAGCAVAEVYDRNLSVLDHAARRGPVVAATPELLGELLSARRSADAR